jgi:hypothetical protein
VFSMGLCLLQPRLDVTIGCGSYSLSRVCLGDVGVVTLRRISAIDISIVVISTAGSGTMALVVVFLGVSLDKGLGAVIGLRHDGIDSKTSQLEWNKGSKTVGTQCCVCSETARYRAPRVLAVTVAMPIYPQPN